MKCDFEKLWLYLDKKLDWDAQLKVLEHLGQCEVCCDAVSQIARDRQTGFFTGNELDTGKQANLQIKAGRQTAGPRAGLIEHVNSFTYPKKIEENL